MKNLIILSLVLLVSCGKEFVQTNNTENIYYSEIKKIVNCYSLNYQYDECTFTTQDNPLDMKLTLVKKYSFSNCVINKSFGFIDNNTIFVSNGCRGKFRVTYNVLIGEIL